MTRFVTPRLTFMASLCAALVSMSVSSSATADDEAVAKARAGVAALGKQWNGEINTATQELYLSLQHQADSANVRISSNLSYGTHKLQNFDLFAPEDEPTEPRPVVVYLHGGGLVRGDKVGAGTDGLIYGNIGTFAARHGMIGINANYRLVPEVIWPAGAEDIHLLLEWIIDNVANYGGDPNAIFLMGNSAGSTHVATYLFNEASQFEGGPRVVGALMSSGAFASGDSSAAIDYFGNDDALRESRAPLGLVGTYEGDTVPMFLWSAEYDPPFIETPVAQMYAKLCAKYGDCPRYTQFQGHNHVSHVMSIDSADTDVGIAVIDFIRSVLDGG